MTGKEFADLIARYILFNFGDRGVKVYREVSLGKSIIGKNRRVDIFVHHEPSNSAFAVECKYQEVSGTADEKIPYALRDMEALPMAGCIVYAGSGFSPGVLHLLQGSHLAASCDPRGIHLGTSKVTWELDHMLAMAFRWWDIILGDKEPFVAPAGDVERPLHEIIGTRCIFDAPSEE